MAKSAGSVFLRVVLVLAGLVTIAVAWFAWAMPSREGPRVEATSKIVGVESPHMYAWILRTTNGAALIDTGVDPDARAILDELKRQGLSSDQVHTVLLTHGHLDHAGAAAVFKKAKVYAGREDVAIVRGEKASSKLSGIFTRLHGAPPPPAEVLPLEGGETIDADGTQVRVIATPGHTEGSLMFLVGEVLFTGDALARSKNGVKPLPSVLMVDADQNKKSLEQLVDLPFTLIADGHSGVTANAREKLKRFLGAR